MEIRRRLVFCRGFSLVLFLFILRYKPPIEAAQTPTPTLTPAEVPIGLILDLHSKPGLQSLTSIRMAVDDFYVLHNNYSTRIVLQVLDSKHDSVDSAEAAVDLMKNREVAAIIGPTTSGEVKFVAVLGSATQTPIISYAVSSPFLSVTATPFFVRATVKDSDQSPLIAALVKYYGWHEVVVLYEDSNYGFGVLPSLIDAFQSVDARVTYRAAIAASVSDDYIYNLLYRLKTLATRVFVVHMLPPLASRLFRLANAAGMVEEGYAWIVTDGIANVFDNIGAFDMTVMQGVIGMRPHVPSSPELELFTTRWHRRFRRENPDDIRSVEPSMFQLWAYDATQALAAAVESAFNKSDFRWRRKRGAGGDMEDLGVFEAGPRLLAALQSTDLRGLSGEFRLAGGELNFPPFEIINFVGKGGRTVGFWTPETRISGELGSSGSASVNLKAVVWPGISTTVPKGWEIPTGGKKLQIAVPVKNGFNQFVNVERDPSTNETTFTGYCIDIFDAVMAAMPYSVRYKYIPFKDSAASYDDLVSQVYYKNYDVVIGDTTILANRSKYVEFTLPYTESGVAMVVPLQQGGKTNAWIFLKPLTTDLWLGSLTFFFFTGLVVWVIEHRINPQFRGRPSHQIGTTLYFVFSTLVFSHKEKLESNLSKMVVVIWVFVVLILTSSYTASLTSMLTVQQLQPAANNIDQLLQSKARVGYQDGSFVLGMLKRLGFSNDRLQNYSTPEMYKDAMLIGSRGGGVDAVLDEIPYLKLFLSKYCANFSMVGRTYKTDGFGFVFPLGSPLVADVSRAILNVTESDIMMNIERKWFGGQGKCPAGNDGAVSSSSLDFWRFGGLFIITGTVSTFSLMFYVGIFLWKEWEDLRSASINSKERGGSVWKKMAAWAQHYDSVKEGRSVTKRRNRDLQSSSRIFDVSAGNFGSPEVVVSARQSTAETAG